MKEFLFLALVAAAVFGVCALADKVYQKLFRSAPQHKSGKSVRLNKHVGGAGVTVLALGTVAVVFGIGGEWFLVAAGAVLCLTGVGLTVYYMSFGIFYDEEGFLLNTFGKRAATYRFENIRAQQLYTVTGGILIELHLEDGRTVQLQPGMGGVPEFMDRAFAGWLKQKGMEKEDCPFHDPDNSCWFPPVED